MLDVVCSTDVVFRSAFSAVWISMDVVFFYVNVLLQLQWQCLMCLNHSQTISELHVSQCYLYFSVFVRSTEIPVPSYWLEMKTCATHLAATSLELCLNNDFYATHPVIETKIGENPDNHKYSICGMAVWNKAGKKFRVRKYKQMYP